MKRTDYEVGEEVEVCYPQDEGFRHAWFEARITFIDIDSTEYVVQYKHFSEEDGKPTKERKNLHEIRPQRPAMPNLDLLGPWTRGDAVEVFHNNVWWGGYVYALLSGQRYQVLFPDYPDRLDTYPPSQLRSWLVWNPRGQRWCCVHPLSPHNLRKIRSQTRPSSHRIKQSSSNTSNQISNQGEPQSPITQQEEYRSKSISSLKENIGPTIQLSNSYQQCEYSPDSLIHNSQFDGPSANIESLTRERKRPRDALSTEPLHAHPSDTKRGSHPLRSTRDALPTSVSLHAPSDIERGAGPPSKRSKQPSPKPHKSQKKDQEHQSNLRKASPISSSPACQSTSSSSHGSSAGSNTAHAPSVSSDPLPITNPLDAYTRLVISFYDKLKMNHSRKFILSTVRYNLQIPKREHRNILKKIRTHKSTALPTNNDPNVNP